MEKMNNGKMNNGKTGWEMINNGREHRHLNGYT